MKIAMGAAALAAAVVVAAPASATVVVGTSTTTTGFEAVSFAPKQLEYTVTAGDGLGFSDVHLKVNRGTPLLITATLANDVVETKSYSYSETGANEIYITTESGQLFKSVVLNFSSTPQNNFPQNLSIAGKAALPVSDPVTPPAAAAVPEPATWAMMLAGFGLVGAAMRKRSRMAVSLA